SGVPRLLPAHPTLRVEYRGDAALPVGRGSESEVVTALNEVETELHRTDTSAPLPNRSPREDGRTEPVPRCDGNGHSLLLPSGVSAPSRITETMAVKLLFGESPNSASRGGLTMASTAPSRISMMRWTGMSLRMSPSRHPSPNCGFAGSGIA